jgi:MFS family permease
MPGPGPARQRSRLGASARLAGSGLEWVVNDYPVTFGGLPLGGRAGDILGRPRVFVYGLLLFSAASLLGGFATSRWWLLAARPRTAIIAVLLCACARVEECARLDVADIAVAARIGTVRQHGKDDEVRTVSLPAVAREAIVAWLPERGNQAGPLWTGQRGRLTDQITSSAWSCARYSAGTITVYQAYPPQIALTAVDLAGIEPQRTILA